MGAFSKAATYFRGEPSSPLERKLVFKLDFFILTFCCLAYFMNYLDRASVTQAYVSGMKEELGFEGAQLTEVTTLYSVGYLIGIVPNNMLLTRFKPERFFPLMIVIWASLTMLNAAAKKPQHLMAIRFFQGFAESCVFAGTQFILGSWYTKAELGKRTGLFTASGLLGGMFGGFLQSGIYSSMNGLHGLPGWKWLYIICGIITMPVAVYGYFLFPDTPYTTTAPYFSEEEKALARARVPMTEEREAIFTVAFASRVLKTWYFYGFCLLWILGNCSEAQSSQSLLNLFMQAHATDQGYTVTQLNNWPTGVQAIGVVSTLLWALGTDIWGGRWLSGYYVAVTAICNAAIILAPGTGIAAKFGAYYWAGSIYCIQATFFAWANDSMRHQPPTLRSFIIGAMNTAGNLFQVWWPLVFYRSDAAPKFTIGMYAMIGVGAGMAIWTTAMLWMEKYFDKKNPVIIEATANSSSDDVYRESVVGTGKAADDSKV